MSQTQPPYQQPNQPSGKPPIVRLPMWVNVILVLILLASCGGDRFSSGAIANDVANRLSGQIDSGGTDLSSQEDLLDVCRLLGTVLVSSGTSPGRAFSGDESVSACEQAAQEAATSPGRATP